MLLQDGKAEIEMDTTHKLGEGLGLPDVTPVVSTVVQAAVLSKVSGLLGWGWGA